jgi:hypothetical protein
MCEPYFHMRNVTPSDSFLSVRSFLRSEKELSLAGLEM